MTWNKEYELTSLIFSILRVTLFVSLTVLLLSVNRLTNWDSTGMMQYYHAPLGIFFMRETDLFILCTVLIGAWAFVEIMILYVKANDYRWLGKK